MITVWTVGDDYPIAYHVEINACNFNSTCQKEYRNAYLGYVSKRNVKIVIKESISELVDDFAVAFFKARGEL
ncbi:MAG: hypothetical protein K8S27_01770 [Candidatus Omnitrophica bacterium]|nr:hypothetical protein [Candidatus Omnitrophota bacterium]